MTNWRTRVCRVDHVGEPCNLGVGPSNPGGTMRAKNQACRRGWRWLPKSPLLVPCLLALAFSLSGPSQSASIAALSAEGMRACYGSVITVRLEHTGALLDIPVDLGADFFPPSTITNGAARDIYSTWRASCHPEPVPVESVYVYRNHQPTPSLEIIGDAPSVRRFSLDPGNASTYRMNEGRVLAALAAKSGASVSGGLLRLEPDLEGKVGLYLADPVERTPTGEPLVIDCVPGVFSEECRVSYGLGHGVSLTYWFMATKVPQDRWVELDHLMRRVAEGMIVKGGEQ